MRCPYCHADNDRVIDSRASQDNYAIRRRRQCLGCKRRFTTHERIERSIKVVKKDDSRVPLDREKIRRGLAKACEKRPISDERIEEVVAAIENDVYKECDEEVESSYIGERAMFYLRDLDQVAYVRFASVYREFKDVRDFVDELQPMLAESRRTPR